MVPVAVVYPDAPAPEVPLIDGVTMTREPVEGAANIGMNLSGLDGLLVLEPPAVRPDLYEPARLGEHRWVFAYYGPEWDRADYWSIPTTLPPLWPRPKPVPRPWEERKQAVAYLHRPHSSPVAGELYSLREWLLPQIHRIVPVERLAGVPFGQAKVEVLSQYRYCFCPENFLMENYITEKVVDALAAGCIPIYAGAGDIPKQFCIHPLELWRLQQGDPSSVQERCRQGEALARFMDTRKLWKRLRSVVNS